MDRNIRDVLLSPVLHYTFINYEIIKLEFELELVDC